MAKKKVVAGVFGNTTYYFNEKGNIVDDRGQDAPVAIANALKAGITPTPPAQPAPSNAKPAQPRDAKGRYTSPQQPQLSQASQSTTSPQAGRPSRPGEVTKLAQKIAGAPGASAAGVAGTVGSAIKEQTIGSAFSLKGMAAAMSESLGLKGLGLALGDAFGGKKGGQGGGIQAKQFDTLTGILEVTKDNKEILMGILDAIKGNQVKNIEAQREAAAVPGATGNQGAGKEKGGGGGFFGGLIAAIAATLGSILGVFQGWFKAIRAFGETLLPKSLIQFIEGKFAGIGKFFEDIFTKFKGVVNTVIEGASKSFKSVGGVVASAVESIAGVFSKITNSEVFTKTIKAVTGALDSLIKPFQEAFVLIKDLASGGATKMAGIFSKIGEFFKPILSIGETIGVFFSEIFSGLSKFGAIFKGAASIVSKLAAPLMIVMTVWDTVKGAIEGYEQDGIVGAIGGAIKGFFNSLIFGPLDMIKDAAAWVLGFFGFDKAKEILESFSFEKMFSSFVDGFIDTVKYVKNYVTEAVPKMIDAFKEWWDSFSIIEPIMDAFSKMKTMIVDKISSLADGITGFFKDLPGNLIGSLPDGMIKNSLMKFIGGGKEPEKQAEATAPSGSNYEKYRELGRKNVTEFLSSDVAADPIHGKGAIMAFKEGQAQAGITPMENPTAMGVVAGTNKNALEASISSAPVIINNNNVGSVPSAPPPTPRTSGAVSTAPAPSLLDLTLYGRSYGGGYL